MDDLQLSYPLVTERLSLRPYTMDDAEDYYKLTRFPETHRYNYGSPPSAEEVQKRITEFTAYDYKNPEGRLELVITLRESKTFIGFIGFKAGELKPGKTTEVFYTLHRDYFGKGYATEALREMLRFGFEDIKLHRIWAGATVENIGSWKVMEKNGMRRECHWVHDRPMPGKWVEGKGFEQTGEWEDGYGYAITREEFIA